MRRPKWGDWVREARKQNDLSMRELAALAQIDPSYLTLIERDGYVPKRYVTESLVESLTPDKREQDKGMLLAGYSPRNVSSSDLLKALHDIYEARGGNGGRSGGKNARVVPAD